MSAKYFKKTPLFFLFLLFCLHPSILIYPQENLSVSKNSSYDLNEILNSEGKIKKVVNGSFNTNGYNFEIDPKTSEPVLRKISKNDSIPIPRWSPLAQGADHMVNVITIDGNDVYIGGRFKSVKNSDGAAVPNTKHLAKWNGNSWSALGNGTKNTVSAIAVSGNNVYVGGAFTGIQISDDSVDTNCRFIARWDGTNWHPLLKGVENEVMAIAVNGNDIYAGGWFRYVYNSEGKKVKNTRGIVKWNGTNWIPMAGGSSGNVYSIVANGSDIYVGGLFRNVKNSDGSKVPNTMRIARWGGATEKWFALGKGIGGNAVLTMLKDGNDLYVGGTFGFVKTNNGSYLHDANNIVKWDGTNWHALAKGADGPVQAMAMSGRFLYIGGWFNSVKNSTGYKVSNTKKMAKWNRTSWSSCAVKINDGIYSMANFGDQKLFVGGLFTSITDLDESIVTNANHIAIYDPE